MARKDGWAEVPNKFTFAPGEAPELREGLHTPQLPPSPPYLAGVARATP